MQPNFANFANLSRPYLFENNSAIGAFIAVESQEGTTPFPAMDRKHTVGKFTFIRASIYIV